MSAPTDPLELAAGFAVADEAAWRALVAAVLRRSGSEPDDPVAALTSTTYDGIEIAPLHTGPCADPGAPGVEPYVRGATVDGATLTGWDVRTLVRDADPVRARDAALHDLETGATSLWLPVGDAGTPVTGLGTALAGVLLDLAPIALDAGADTLAAARVLLDLAGRVDHAAVRGTLGADPIGLRARTGAVADLDLLGELADAASDFPDLCVATVDATVYHDAGAAEAGEIAIATAVGVAYLRALVDAGLGIDRALAVLEFRFAVTADQFASIAKLRAARRVWGRVGQLSGADPAARGQRVHAVTSSVMMTRRDPWVNLMRTTLGCFAAAVAGADAITVLPFDTALGRSDDLARRIARNTQAVLHDESSLGRVVDAAGGSWYVEDLTARLAGRAWELFTAIERDGGALAALDSGALEAMIAPARAARADDIAHRRAALTGLSEFALPDETPVERPQAPGRPTGGPLPPVRWAEPFEALRDRAERTDPRPTVYLATLGPSDAHGARVAFATNLFNAGGVRVLVGPPEDFADAGTGVACLCASDSGYADGGAAAVAALRAGGAGVVWLAGGGDVAGVDDTIAVGCDAIAVLGATLDALDVSA